MTKILLLYRYIITKMFKNKSEHSRRSHFSTKQLWVVMIMIYYHFHENCTILGAFCQSFPPPFSFGLQISVSNILIFNYPIFCINSFWNTAQSWEPPVKVFHNFFFWIVNFSSHIFNSIIAHLYLFVLYFLVCFLLSAVYDKQLTRLNLLLYSFIH